MAKASVTIKLKTFKLELFINLIKLVGYVNVNRANKMLEWLSDNIDKFYTIKR